MDEYTVFGIVLATLSVFGFFGWIACLIYFTKKNEIILRAIGSGCDPILAHRIFKDTSDELSIIRLLSNQAINSDGKLPPAVI